MEHSTRQGVHGTKLSKNDAPYDIQAQEVSRRSPEHRGTSIHGACGRAPALLLHAGDKRHEHTTVPFWSRSSDAARCKFSSCRANELTNSPRSILADTCGDLCQGGHYTQVPEAFLFLSGAKRMRLKLPSVPLQFGKGLCDRIKHQGLMCKAKADVVPE